MIINHNIAALNTHRQLGTANIGQSNSMEKLSSGLRINSAADDAAGLAISEKMRAQVRGLDQAAANAQDGISLIQTAEGALQESQDILQRMRELAVQSSNDTNTDEDRAEIQKEVNQLTEELTRIGNNTEFNTQELIDGNYNGKILHIGANEGQNIEVSISDMRAEALGVGTDYKATSATGITYGPNDVAATFKGEEDSLVIGTVEAGNDGYYDKSTGELLATGDKIDFTTHTYYEVGQTFEDFENQEVEVVSAGYYKTNQDSDEDKAVVLKSVKDISENENAVHIEEDGDITKTVDVAGYYDDVSGDLIVKAEAAFENGAEGVAALDVSSQSSANDAIKTFDNAINAVSSERSKLGALQNRLEHTINNLGTSSENLTAAEARIRDVDMAKEIMELSKNSILSQAAQAMLAQANQQPQAVLQLLQ